VKTASNQRGRSRFGNLFVMVLQSKARTVPRPNWASALLELGFLAAAVRTSVKAEIAG